MASTAAPEGAVALQLVSVEDDGRLKLVRATLEAVLASAKNPEAPVVVVSVAGPARTGKSLLLSFLVHRLFAMEQLGNSMPFRSAWGRDAVTMGIWCLSQLIPFTLANGTEVGLLVLDSQGLFDTSLSEATTMRIFALSLVCSSCLIHNVSKQVAEDNLQHAALYSAFAKMIRAQGDDAPVSPFNVLFFAVRDWQFDDEDEDDFGPRGDVAKDSARDDAYLNDRLKPRGDADLDSTRDTLRQTFEHLHAALLPHPGLNVASKQFDGRLSSTRPEFQRQVGVFCNRVESAIVHLARPNLTTSMLPDVLEVFVAALNDPELPNPTTLFNVLAQLNNARALKEASARYSARFKPEDLDFEASHSQAREEAMALFAKKSKFGPLDLIEQARAELVASMDESFARLRAVRAMAQRRRTRMKRAAVVVAAGVVVSPLIAPLVVSSAVSYVVTGVRSALMLSATVVGVGQEGNTVALSLLSASGTMLVLIGLAERAWSHWRPARPPPAE